MFDTSKYSDVISNLTAAYESRLKNITAVRDITAELKRAIEDEEKAAVSDEPGESDLAVIFDDVLNRREIRLDEKGVIATTVNHYKSELPPDMRGALESAERGAAAESGFEFINAVKKIIAAEKLILAEIKADEDFNVSHMGKLMKDIKAKLDNVKKNRIIMDKFVNDDSDMKAGALIHKKE